MKSYKILFLLIALLGVMSCNEEEWLEEKPFSFYTPENSYTTPAQFEAAVARLYQKVPDELMNTNGAHQRSMHFPTDILHDAIAPEHDLNLYSDKLFATTGVVYNFWKAFYNIIFNCNVILDRIDKEEVVFADESHRANLKAEATFFRAFAYRTLAIVYGDVPIVLNEIDSPKRDFSRAPKADVLAQAVTDLTYSIDNLPTIDNVRATGRISKAAAQHLISEVYISLEQYDNAIAAATSVIDNPNFELMTDRFGTRSAEPGDVYWDLFRRDNQNRTSGNTEAIYVHQYEYNVPGGGTSFTWPRWLNSLYWQLTDTAGVNLFIGPTVQNGGRGIGWYAPNDYMLTTVWERDTTDIRNSSFNIIRDVKADNPASSFFGQNIVESGAISKFNNNYRRWWNAIFVKTVPINNFPEDFVKDPETGLTESNANETHTDYYVFRLAETYLLRAEAYIKKGDLANAAASINAVRARANASLITAADATLDFILDERARELAFEQPRVITLMRFEKLVERVRQYNEVTQDKIDDHQNLWPIPQREIETNIGATLTQNPGY